MTTAQQLEPTCPSRRRTLFLVGAAAAVHIVGCTVDESDNGTFGSGGNSNNSVAAGADGGAPGDAGAPDTGAARR